MRDPDLALKAADVLGTAIAVLCEMGADAASQSGPPTQLSVATDLEQLGADILALASALAVVARRFV